MVVWSARGGEAGPTSAGVPGHAVAALPLTVWLKAETFGPLNLSKDRRINPRSMGGFRSQSRPIAACGFAV
jgi:hypothetical protein